MVKKKINNSNKKADYFGVLLENMDSKIDTVLEGHSVLDKKIDNLGKDMNKRFNEVDYKFEITFGELRLIRNELKEKIGRDEFIFLEKRVAALEKAKTK